MPDAAREATLKNFYAAINDLDTGRWVAQFSADAVCEDPVGSPPLAGHAALRAFFSGISAAFAAVEMTPEAFHFAGDGAGVQWRAKGTGKNGRKTEFAGIDTFEFDGAGKIRRQRSYWDPVAMMAQLQG